MPIRLTQRDKQALKGVAREAAQEFLRAELRALERKIQRRVRRLEMEYPDASELPRGQTEALQSYQERKELLEDLIEACEQKLLIDVFRDRLERSTQRMEELRPIGRDDPDVRPQYRKARAEREMVSELMGRWLLWMKRNQPEEEEPETEQD
jgi:hypothetical protein